MKKKYPVTCCYSFKGSYATASRRGIYLSDTDNAIELVPLPLPGTVATTVNERCADQDMIH